MPDSNLVIRARNLSKQYGQHLVVQDVSFDLRAGETLVLLGPSGCGKTTLLKTLNRLVEPDTGTVEVQGQDVRAQRPEALRRGIGYVIQQVGLLPHLTVAENIGLVPKLLNFSATQTATRTQELLTRLHLSPERFAGLYPRQLSGGQQQRVGLARALAADPPIVLLDEPFGALDPITRAGIRREFLELDELRSKTIVLVTHDVQEAFELADRILLLDAGRVQQLGTPRELLFEPANEFVRRFFDAERLSLQLRTLQLNDLLFDLADSTPSDVIYTYKSEDQLVSCNATVQSALEQLSAPTLAGKAKEKEATLVPAAENSLAASPLASSLTAVESAAVLWVQPTSNKATEPSSKVEDKLAATPQTTLTPITLPTLMAAFGQAIQRLQHP